MSPKKEKPKTPPPFAFRADRAALLKIVGHAATVAPKKSPKPCLECVVLSGSDDGFSVQATDLDIGLTIDLPGTIVEHPGRVVVQAARLKAILAECEAETVSLAGIPGEEHDLRVTDGNGDTFDVRGEPAEDYPVLARMPTDPAGAVVLPWTNVREAFRRTEPFTAREAGRFSLHGLRLACRPGNRLDIVGTDGRRLALSRLDLAPVFRDAFAVNLPTSASSTMIRACNGFAGDVVLRDGTGDDLLRYFFLRAGNVEVVARKIDGPYPPYEDVVPRRSDLDAVPCKRDDLLRALKRASLLTSRDAVSVEIRTEPGFLVVSSRAVEIGKASAKCPTPYEGPARRFGCNPAFLSEAAALLGPDVVLHLPFHKPGESAKAPGILSDSDDYSYVLMPIALD